MKILKNLVLIFCIMQDVIYWSETYFNDWNTKLQSNLWFTLFNQLNMLPRVNFQTVSMSTTICLKHFLEKCRVLVNLIFDIYWFNFLFWHMNYLHWREPDQFSGFCTGVKNMGGGAWVNTLGSMGGFQEKGKYLVNICTVVCKLKNVIFLLN